MDTPSASNLTSCPVIESPDLLIIGASAGAASLALAAAKSGQLVMIVTSDSYLGTDLCGACRAWAVDSVLPLPADDPIDYTALNLDSSQALIQQLYAIQPPTPMHLKLTLEQALIQAGVKILLHSWVTGVIMNESQTVSGVIVSNRTGRQAIKAALVVDATDEAIVATQAGLHPESSLKGPQRVSHTVLYHADAVPNAMPGIVESSQQVAAFTGQINKDEYGLIAKQYTLTVDLGEGTPLDFAKSQARVLDECWLPGEFQAQEKLYPISIPRIYPAGADNTAPEWASEISAMNLTVTPGLLLLSRRAPLTREQVNTLADPIKAIHAAWQLGHDLSDAQCHSTPACSQLSTSTTDATPVQVGNIRILTDALRPGASAEMQILENPQSLPRLGECDVAVIGGGTGGAPAAISAGRAGVSTVLVETTSGLGGVGTMGQIAKYWFGNRVGFTAEMDVAINELETDEKMKKAKASWSVPAKKAWYLQQCRLAGVTVLLNSACVGVWVIDDAVKGLVIATPHGYGLLRCKTTIDSTGCADIPAMAGKPTRVIDQHHVAVQGTGLAGVVPGKDYNNSDHNFCDDTDTADVTAFFIASRLKFKDHFDGGQLVDSRERRQIVGEFTLQPADFMFERRFPDTICVASSNFDTHGFTVHPLFMVKPPHHKQLWVDVPYRCLLPKGLEGVLVTGLGVSAHRDALPVIRMQPDVQNQGYAAGLAAAMASKDEKNAYAFRAVDIVELQKQLIEKGNLPDRVLTDKDTFPLQEQTLLKAVCEGWDDFSGLALIFSDTARALPMVINAYKETRTVSESAKTETELPQHLRYAHILALLDIKKYDPAVAALVVEDLLEAIDQRDWDKGWNYTGMGQFGMSMSELDTLIAALGLLEDARAWPVILHKIEQLKQQMTPDFSHCRAVTLACEGLYITHPNDDVASALVSLLAIPEITGHAHDTLSKALEALTDVQNETQVRNISLRELHLARALYRCGDQSNQGRDILQTYANDLRGHYARHARAVLAH